MQKYSVCIFLFSSSSSSSSKLFPINDSFNSFCIIILFFCCFTGTFNKNELIFKLINNELIDSFVIKSSKLSMELGDLISFII